MTFNRIGPGLAGALLALAALTSLPATAAADSWDAKARELFRDVIAMKTSEGLGNVPAMAQFLAAQFRAGGFADADIHVVPLGETASLVVRYRGDGSGGKPIDFLAHMDVVTAKREDWQRDPYTLVEENGFFFGRGTADIKEGVVGLTIAFLRLKAEAFKPHRDLIIVFTGDEETFGRTAQDLVTHHRDLIDAEFALNSDAGGGTLSEETGAPLLFTVQTAEKTFASFDITIHNPGGHSSRPHKDNAIYELADVLKRIQAASFPVMSNETTLANLRSLGARTPGALGEAMRHFAANPHDVAAAEVLSNDPAYVGDIRTTCVPTLLRGGHADNALPQSATATINCRIFPGISIASVQGQLQQLAGTSAEIKPLDNYTSSDASPLRSDVIRAVSKAVHLIYPGVEVVPGQSAGATDGVFFRAAGIPTYGVGGIFMKESDDFSHGLNERLPVKSFYESLRYWPALMRDLAGPPARATR